MAWTDACKVEAVAQIEKRKGFSGSLRNAFRELSKESEIPYGTLKRWYYPEGVPNNGNTLAKLSVEKETCATHDYHTLTFDSGHKKILFSIHLTDDDLYLVMQEFKVGRNGKETPTKNRFTVSYDNIHAVRSGFDKFFQVDYSGMYRKRDIDVSDPQKDEEVAPPVGDDGGDTQDNEHDAMGVETEPFPAPVDCSNDPPGEAELIRCKDCNHFAVKTWAPDENGSCKLSTGSWNGNIFQPPHEPHPCPNFQDGQPG